MKTRDYMLNSKRIIWDGSLVELPCNQCPWFDDCEAMDVEEE